MRRLVLEDSGADGKLGAQIVFDGIVEVVKTQFPELYYENLPMVFPPCVVWIAR